MLDQRGRSDRSYRLGADEEVTARLSRDRRWSFRDGVRFIGALCLGVLVALIFVAYLVAFGDAP